MLHASFWKTLKVIMHAYLNVKCEIIGPTEITGINKASFLIEQGNPVNELSIFLQFTTFKMPYHLLLLYF